AEVAQLVKGLGATTLYVTHDQTEAMAVGDRVAVMRAGTLEQVDAPRTLYERPCNLFVATFIGDPAASLVPALVDRAGAEPALTVGRQQLRWPPARQPRLRAWPGREVVLAARTEHIRLATGAPGEQRLTGTVTRVEPL